MLERALPVPVRHAPEEDGIRIGSIDPGSFLMKQPRLPWVVCTCTCVAQQACDKCQDTWHQMRWALYKS